jgi:hypothetical protein
VHHWPRTLGRWNTDQARGRNTVLVHGDGSRIEESAEESGAMRWETQTTKARHRGSARGRVRRRERQANDGRARDGGVWGGGQGGGGAVKRFTLYTGA